MPGDVDVVIVGNPTLKLLGIDVYDSLGARARKRAALAGVDTAAYRQYRRVTVSEYALHRQTSLTPEEPDDAVERLVARIDTPGSGRVCDQRLSWPRGAGLH